MSMSSRHLVGLFLCAALALAPALAEARAGGGMSAGSRGSRTYQSAPATPTAPQSRPVQRSLNSPTQPQRQTTAPYASQRQPSFFQRNPFVSGLLGGLIGAGIAGMLFGHGFFGAGLGGAGLLGLLLQLAIIGGIVWFVMRALRRRNESDSRPAFAYAHGDDAARAPMPDVAPIDINTGRTGAAPSRSASDEIGITEADYHEFERLLVEIQSAWSRSDLAALRRLATPEMVSYFSEKLSADASAGVQNKVESIKLQQGDLAEAWREGAIDYATVAMRWAAIDYTVNVDTGALVEGSKTEYVEETEVWTFMRTTSGRWLLAAIQQV